MQVVGHDDPCKRVNKTAIGCVSHFSDDHTREATILKDFLALAGYRGNKVGAASL
jgi:hypothetical protein